MIDVKMLHSINPLLMVYVYFFIFKTANTQRHLFHHSEVLMSNLNFFFCRLILNFIAAVELLQTWSCTYISAAVEYIYRSGWIVSEMRHEHSLLSMWKSWPSCQLLSQSPATCIPQISPGSWLVFWVTHQRRGTELRLRENVEGKVRGDAMKKCE